MSISYVISKLSSQIFGLMNNTRGIAATEFALIFPVMLSIYFGVVEVAQVLSADRKVTNVASTTADLVAQATDIDTPAILDVFQASSSIIAPFNQANITIVVTSIVADASNNTTVAWSDAHNGGTARTPGAQITVPQGLTQANTSVILAEVSYQYTSIIGEFITGTISLTDRFYTRPRNSIEVERS